MESDDEDIDGINMVSLNLDNIYGNIKKRSPVIRPDVSQSYL